jgi:hypothetical protein
MAIKTTINRKINILSLSYAANADLSALRYCAVAPVAASSGLMKVGAPSGQGVLTVGILQTYNVDAANEQAEVLVEGVSSAIADATFNCGVELTASGADGKLEAASSGDYVIAISEEAAAEADQVVTVRVVSPYQKN